MRWKGPLDISGGVGEASNPGGFAGESRGRSSEVGETSSTRAALTVAGTSVALPRLPRLKEGVAGNTVAGERGGDAGGVRLSKDLRLAVVEEL